MSRGRIEREGSEKIKNNKKRRVPTKGRVM